MKLATLPVLYVLSVVLANFASVGVAGGVFYRIISLNPTAVLFMMSVDNSVPLLVIFLITGTPWWFFISWLGYGKRSRKKSVLYSGVGAALCGITCLICLGFTMQCVAQDIVMKHIDKIAIAQYMLVITMCVCSLLSMFSSLKRDKSSGDAA